MVVTREVLRIENAALEQVTDRVDAKHRALVAAWAVTWDQVSAELEAAITELAAANTEGRVTRTMVTRSQRLQRALQAVGDALDVLADQTGMTIASDITQAVQDAVDEQTAMLTAQLPTAAQVARAGIDPLRVEVVRADPRQVAAMVDRATQRITKTTRPLGREVQAQIRRELLRGVSVGANPRVAARRMLRGVEDQFDGGLARAMTIARTETIDAHRQAAQTVEEANTDVVAKWRWEAHLGNRTCRACLSMHGQEFPVDQAGPLGHQNCRCARVPVTKSWEELGFRGIKEPAPILRDAEQHFRSLSETDQRAILGDHGYTAWKRGDYPMDRWSRTQHNDGWRDSVVATRPPAPRNVAA